MFSQEPFESVGGSKHNVQRIIPPKGFLENVLEKREPSKTLARDFLAWLHWPANHGSLAALRTARYPGRRARFRFVSTHRREKGPSRCSSTSTAVDGYLAILMYTTPCAARLPTLLAVLQCRLTIAWPQSTSTRQRRRIVTRLLAGWRRTPTVSTATLRASSLAVIAQVATWRQLSR